MVSEDVFWGTEAAGEGGGGCRVQIGVQGSGGRHAAEGGQAPHT